MEQERNPPRGASPIVGAGLPRRRGAVLAFLALLTLGAPAGADPRWWWDDSPVGSVPAVSDVDVAVVAETGLPLVIFVAWVEPPTLIEGALRLTASFDGGCTFCPPVHLASLFGTDDDVAIAAAPFVRGIVPTASVAVVHSAAGRLQVLHDAGSVPLAGVVGDCRSLQDFSLNAVRTELSPGDADQPDVAAVTHAASGLTEFHAVWHQIAATDEEQVAHARDLDGDGNGWEVRPPLPSDAPPFARVADPHLSLDLSTPSGAGTGVNAVWTLPEFNQVLYLRSVDSGDTFSATGEPPVGSPAVVAQAGLGASGPVALDSGTSTDRGDPPWHGVLFFQDRGPASLLVFDAQHQEAPTVPGPAWGPELDVAPFGALRDQGLAASVLPGGAAGEPQPAWLFWTDPSPPLGTEVFARGGLLDSDAAVPVDLDAPAFPPVRPDDPSASVPDALTHCLTDPATGACVPDRVAGAASRPASADGFGDVFVTWIDDRDGRPAVWFKRTDRTVDATDPSLLVSCPDPAERRISVSFDQVPGCRSMPVVAERIRRYLIYYGTDPAGPFENTDLDGSEPLVPDTIIVVDDGSLVDPVSVDVDGLLAGTTYHVVVVPEDEAGNVYPPDFDPLADGVVPPTNERSVTTPVDCGPCLPFVFGGTVTAMAGDCVVDLSWPPATGVEPIVYDVLRDGLPVALGLSATSWTDLAVTWGVTHAYAVTARDSCADPGPREETTPPSAAIGPDDLTAPTVSAMTLTVVAACTVRVDAVVDDACSGPAGLAGIWRDGLLVASDVPLPHDDVVPADGSYSYELRATDNAGNEGVSSPESVDVVDCTVGPCLYRATAASLDPSGLLASPRGPNDIAFTPPNDAPYGPCPFASGDTDPETVLGPSAPPLIYYQVEGAGLELHLVAEPALGTVRLTFF